MRTTLPALILACGVSLAAERVPVPPQLSLPEAVRIALAHSPTLQLAGASVAYKEALADLTLAERKPHIGIDLSQAGRTVNLAAQGIQAEDFAGIDGAPIPRRVGPFGTFDARAGLTQEVWNMPLQYHSRAERRRAEAAAATALGAREQVALAVSSAYIEALKLQAQEATLRRQIALARQLDTITADRVEAGVASVLDRRRAQQQVRLVQQLLVEAEAGLIAAKLELSRLMHAEISSDFELSDIDRFFDRSLLPVDAALESAFQSRADYLTASKELEAASLDRQAASSGRSPRVTFSADYGQSGQQIYRNLNTYEVRGDLSLPLYFGGRLSAEKQRAQAGIDAARAKVDELEARIESEVRTALAAAAAAEKQVTLAVEGVQLAQDEVDLTTARFVEGAADNAEIVFAQERLTRAEGNRIRALYNFNLSRARLYAAIGQSEKTYLQ